MPRPNQTSEKRRELLPIVTRTFAELGFRRTTTAELARRCDVQENILYRLWPDKKAMFIASIEYVYDLSAAIWNRLLRESDDGHTTAERLLGYESRHHGEFGHYRIVFAGLSETDDPEIRDALVRMYKRYHSFIEKQIAEHRRHRGHGETLTPALAAWAIIGMGTMGNIGRELNLLSERQRKTLMSEADYLLLDGARK